MTISALPSCLLPATNKRNAFVLLEHLEDALGVPQTRGFISFLPIPEENVACNGKTIGAALDETLEDSAGNAMGVIEEEITTSLGSRRKRLSVKVRSPGHGAAEGWLSHSRLSHLWSQKRCSRTFKKSKDITDEQKQSLSNIRTPSAAAAYEITPPTSAEDNAPTQGDKPVRVAKRRKSFVAGLFGRTNGKKENEKQAAEGS